MQRVCVIGKDKFAFGFVLEFDLETTRMNAMYIDASFYAFT
jgi:hypothetical protein